jgi:signal peptidase I
MNKRGKYSSSVKDMSVSLLNQGTTIRIKAHGYSMYPSIKPGAMLVIEPIKVKGAPVKGEIVALRRENGMVVHRIIDIVIENGVRKYIARGDSNAFADDPVTIEKVAGRVIRAEPTGENPEVADIRIRKNPGHFLNRLRVIFLILWKKIIS